MSANPGEEYADLIGIEALRADRAKPVMVCADVEALEAARELAGEVYVCVTWLGGERGWREFDWAPLAGRTILCWFPHWELATYLACQTEHTTKVLVEKERPVDFITQGWDAFVAWARAKALPIDNNQAVSWWDQWQACGGMAAYHIIQARLKAGLDPVDEFPDLPPGGPPDPDPPPLLQLVGGTDLGEPVIEAPPGERLWPAPLDLTALGGREPAQPRFIVDDWLPAGYASLLSGHGGVGKSGIALHLAVCIALGRSFFGTKVERRRVMYMSCEDRENVLHWRLARICAFEGVELQELTGWLVIVDLVGKETTLWQGDAHGGGGYTLAFAELDHSFRACEAEVLFVDGIADTFAGNENARVDVKRYINRLISLIDPDNGAIVLIGHVAKPVGGVANPEGYSGSTGWHNSVRARWYLYPEQQYGDEGKEKTGDLLLDLQKSNLGAADLQIKFTWHPVHHMFVGAERAAQSFLERGIKERQERAGILLAIEASIDAGVRVPATVQGSRTAYHVLSARPEFPDSLKGSARATVNRFNRHVMEMRQAREVTTEAYKTADRKMTEILIPGRPGAL